MHSLVFHFSLVGTLVASPLTEGVRPRAATEAGIGTRVPAIEGIDFAAHKVTAIVFVSPSCPLSARLMPTVAALEDEFSPRGAQFVYVCPVAADDLKKVRAAATIHGFGNDVIMDGEMRIACVLRAASTTEVFVVDAKHTLLYRGAVDDQYGIGYNRAEARNEWLRHALEAGLASQFPMVTATTVPGCVLALPDKNAQLPPSGITWHNRISRLMQTHCQECHRPEGPGPFALESLIDVVSRAGMITTVVQRGIMPPWFAAPPKAGTHSPFMNDRTLPAADKGDLLAWLASTRPEGDPSHAPIARKWPDAAWAMGKPDQIIEIPHSVEIQATGRMKYIHMQVPTTFAEDLWVQAIEVQPTARAHVHHILVFITQSDKDGKVPVRDPNNFFAAYIPGNNLLQYPAGTAKRLPRGAILLFQLHYTPTGTAAVDRTRLGLCFASGPPKREVLTGAAANHWIRILPGIAHHEEKAVLPVVFDAEILSFLPHMHVRGKAFRYELAAPDGSRRTLLDIPHYDFNSQLLYRLAEPLAVTSGSRIEVTAIYDNSAENPANPDPSKVVRWGEQTEDEMLLGYFEYVNPALDPRRESAEPSAGSTEIKAAPRR